MRNITSHAVGVVLLAAGVAACSVPEDRSMVVIERQEVQRRLPEPTTTTTTTVASTTTIAAPAVTSSTAPPTTIPESTTTPAPLEPTRLYFVVGDGLIEVVRTLTIKPDLNTLVAYLMIGPMPAEVDQGARTAIEPDDIIGVDLRAGTLTVEISPKFRELPSAEQRRAIAQLVLTYTAQAGVGQVTFVSGQRRIEVPRANGTFGAGTVSRDDYESMMLTPATTSSLPLLSDPLAELTSTTIAASATTKPLPPAAN